MNDILNLIIALDKKYGYLVKAGVIPKEDFEEFKLEKVYIFLKSRFLL